MIDRDDSRSDTADRRAPEGDAIARLLRAAGPRPGVPAERAGRVRRAVHEHWRRAVRGPRLARRLAWSAALLAAAAAWVLLVGRDLSRWFPEAPFRPDPTAALQRTEGSVRWADREPPVVGEGLPAGTGLETAAEGRVALRLHSGASVRVDVDTSLRLLSAESLFLERGAVYVDRDRPSGAGAGVVVRTPLGLVRDVGTQFQVRATADAVRVSVREGIARFERDGSAHEAAPGIQIRVGQDGSVSRRSVPSSGPEWDWILSVAPAFDLEGRLLGEYLDWVGRETGLRVEYAVPSIASDASTVVLHGSIEGLRPDETLGAVLPTCGLSHRIRGDSLILERAAPEAAP